jgi:hypothetical protein
LCAQHAAEVIVSVARKTDAALWPALFDAVGPPAALCDGLMKGGALQASKAPRRPGGTLGCAGGCLVLPPAEETLGGPLPTARALCLPTRALLERGALH